MRVAPAATMVETTKLPKNCTGVAVSGVGIDLGTANTVVYHPKRGVIANEPSVMVVRNGSPGKRVRPLMVGTDARALTGRCPGGLLTLRPLQDGVIVDLEVARRFLAAMPRIGD